MPAAKPPEFRRRAIALARAGDQSIARIAADLGIAESCLRRWLKQDDLDSGRRDDGLTSDERKELAELRRRNRTLEMEVEILKRARVNSTCQCNTSRSARRWGNGQAGAAGDVGSAAGASMGVVGIGQVLQ